MTLFFANSLKVRLRYIGWLPSNNLGDEKSIKLFKPRILSGKRTLCVNRPVREAKSKAEPRTKN